MVKTSGSKRARRSAITNNARVSPPPTKAARPIGATFPIVGIGASAGGLEALEQFLRHVPENSGMAFVIIQHQDPTRKGVLAGLLQRVTTMPVKTSKDATTRA